MNKIHIITQAYNAEKFLSRMIDSVLSQSYKNFSFYILDSNSTDNTMDIIKDYARKDKRIIPLHNDYNNKYTAYMEKIPNIIKNANENDYFMMIDHDDSYHYDAFEKLVTFLEDNNLDLTIGKIKYIDTENKNNNNEPMKEGNKIYKRENYAFNFPAYQKWIRSVWNKVIPIRILKKCNFEKTITMKFASDTSFMLEVIKNTNSFGVLDESTINYSYSPSSLSYQFYKERINDGEILFSLMYDFLCSFGPITNYNRSYLLQIYLNSIRSTIEFITKQVPDLATQIEYKKQIFASPLTIETFLLPDIPLIEKYSLMYIILNTK
ncbi:MAG: glycosyltransferase family 2 protein [Coprobacillaceae bacterium]